MKTETFEDAVLKAVTWWSDKSFRTGMNQNNGDDSEQGGLAFLLMNMVAANSQKSVTDEKIKAFKEKLSELIIEKRKSGYTGSIFLDVDYHPCMLLGMAAEHAGIDAGCFPCKSHTKITVDNRVFAKYQYGGTLIEL